MRETRNASRPSAPTSVAVVIAGSRRSSFRNSNLRCSMSSKRRRRDGQCHPIQAAQNVFDEARHRRCRGLCLFALQGFKRCLPISMRAPRLQRTAGNQRDRQQRDNQRRVARCNRAHLHRLNLRRAA